ncbi:MAG TPA: hypothetical protein PKI62_13400 [bacterium]|nr:hypothetical protein [bacterium]HPR89547.1 hypothetical protein [bacterium]
MRRALAYILFAAGLALAGENTAPAAAWKMSHRLQAGWEQDSNVYEALSGPRSGQDLRLLYELRAGGHRGSRTFRLGYRSGGQFYSGLSRENKLIQEAEAGVELPLTPALRLGWTGYGRIKLFLKRGEDYAFGRGQLYLGLRLPARLLLKVGCSGEGLDYPGARFYDYSAPGLFLQLQRPVGGRFVVSGHASLQRLHYRRSLYQMVSRNEAFPLRDAYQRDRIASGGLRVEASWQGFLGQLGYRYEKSASNAPGYDYGRSVLEASFVQQLAGWYFRGVLTLQKKQYRDNLYPFWPLQLDTEQEESNFLVADLSRPLMERIELILRAAWYRNESPWANLYYRKRLLSFHFELRI